MQIKKVQGRSHNSMLREKKYWNLYGIILSKRVQRIQGFLYTYKNSYNCFIDLCSAINSLCIIEEKLSKEEAGLMSIDTKTLVTDIVVFFYSFLPGKSS